MPVTVAQFVSHFRKAVTALGIDVYRSWQYFPPTTEFTRRMSDVAARTTWTLGLELRCEETIQFDNRGTRKPDFLMYRLNRPELVEQGVNWNAVCEVALEIEGVDDRAPREMETLSWINAPLNVLVTYPSKPGRTAVLLNQYAEHISANAGGRELGLHLAALGIDDVNLDAQWEFYRYNISNAAFAAL